MDTTSALDRSRTTDYSTIRQLAATVKTVVWITDNNDYVTYLNPGAASLLEQGAVLSAASVRACLIHPDDQARVNTLVATAKADRQEYQADYRFIKPDGAIGWIMSCASPRFSERGDFLGYVGVLIDVTDKHRALEQVTESEAAYRVITENSFDLISHHTPDSGIYLYASPAFKRILGYEPADLVGNISIYEQVHPEDERIIRQEVLEQFKAGSSRLIEFRVRHKEGHYVWIGTNVKVLTDPVTNEKIGSVAVSRDVSFERQAKEELKKREERFRHLTMISSDWYWETDEQDRFSFLPESLTRPSGLPPERLIGKTRHDLAVDPEQPELLEYFAKVAKRVPFKDIRYATRGPAEGVIRYVNISGAPVFENGVFKGYRGVGRDITDDVEAAEKLALLADENKALVENSLDVMAMLDHDGRYLRVNGALTDSLGYRPEEILGRRYSELIHPEDLPRAEAVRARLLHTDRNIIKDFQSRWVHKNGAVVHLSSAILWSRNKKVMYATSRDITEQYRTQLALQKSRDQLSSMLETIGDAFFALDNDWRITYVNHKAAEFAGVSVEDSLGKRIGEAVPEFLHSEAFPCYQRAMETRENAFFETYYKPAGAWVEVRIYVHDDGLSVYFHDITARRDTETAIRESERRFREVIEMTPAGYILADGHSRILDVNPALCCMSGYTRRELIGQGLEKLFAYCPWHGALAIQHGPTSAHAMEATVKHKNGHELHVLFSGSIRRGGDGHAQSFTAFLTDITARKKAESRLEQLATHDTLTGLPNRAFLNERVQQMLNGMPHGHSVAVLFIDLDRFKEVNDSFGHEPGDVLLCEIGARLQKNLRPCDIIARLGGDEFVVAAPCAKGMEAAARIAEKLLAELNAPIEIVGQEVFVSASIGISMYPQDGQTKELLFQQADTAMYRAKADGRNCYRFFESEMSEEAKSRLMLENSLRRALDRNEFELHYQPRIDLKTMTVTGMEALIRWNHPVLGRVPPMQFIPIAEERGLIESIGQWVLEEACMQTRRLMDKLGRPLCVSVNLSARQLKSRNIIQHVKKGLTKAGLPPHLLELELTESALIEDMEASAGVLKELKKLGIFLSVDDFGTGYSGLAYLRSFPLNTLKLDRSFLTQQSEEIGSFKFIKAFVDMAHALNLSVLAEGVETSDTLRLLQDADCDEAQGYYFSKPLPLDEFEAFLTRLPAVSE